MGNKKQQPINKTTHTVSATTSTATPFINKEKFIPTRGAIQNALQEPILRSLYYMNQHYYWCILSSNMAIFILQKSRAQLILRIKFNACIAGIYKWVIS